MLYSPYAIGTVDSSLSTKGGLVDFEFLQQRTIRPGLKGYAIVVARMSSSLFVQDSRYASLFEAATKRKACDARSDDGDGLTRHAPLTEESSIHLGKAGSRTWPRNVFSHVP